MKDPRASTPEPTPRRRATIDDVALAAGVSRQTVSNVLRDRGRLSEPTRARVLEAVETLRYTPHLGARSMRSRRTAQFAHPMPPMEFDPGNAIAVEFLQALVRAAGDRDHHVLLTVTRSKRDDVDGLIRSGRIDGFIFSNLEPDDPRIREVADRGFPFACFGRVDPTLPQNWVDVDNAAGITCAVQRLHGGGHTDIAFLGYNGQAYWDLERIAGYRSAMTAIDLAPRIVLTENRAPAIAAAATGLFGESPGPTAVVCSSDRLAAAVYAAADRHGRTIGRDLAVTGFDGSIVGRNLYPPLTTLAIPLPHIASLVVDRVLREIAAPTTDPGHMVDLQLINGDSG